MSLLCFRSRISPHGRSCGWQTYLRQVWPYGTSRRCNVSVSLCQMSGTNGPFACRMNGQNHMQLAVRTRSCRRFCDDFDILGSDDERGGKIRYER
jgi:hypothetical protein